MKKTPVEIFTRLFQGNTNAYGVHIPDKAVSEGAKTKGQSFTRTEPVVVSLYKLHCEGSQSLGIIPIDACNNVRFAAIDIDEYPNNARYFAALLDRLQLPLVPFRSKSGGLHLYCFFKSDTPAKDALDCLKEVCQVLGLKKETETFPKQKALTTKQRGNWINLPYFGGDASERYAYDAAGQKMSFADAMALCEAQRVSLKELIARIEGLPLQLAPPCLQTLYLNNEVSVAKSNRNEFLFNVGIYLKARFKDEFPDKVSQVNDTLDVPLPIAELESSVLASLVKGNYTYRCESGMLAAHCNKELCKARPYGKGGSNISNFSFEALRQVKTDPPYYIWRINGVDLVFYNESELRKQDRFIDQSIRHLHRVPNKLKEPVWNEILNTALRDIEIIHIEKGADISVNSLWFQYLREFLTQRALAHRKSQVSTGLSYRDGREGCYYFKPETFLDFLENTKKFRGIPMNELHYRFTLVNASTVRIFDSEEKKGFRAWKIPINMIESPEDSLVSAVNTALQEPVAPVNARKDEALRAKLAQLDSEEQTEILTENPEDTQTDNLLDFSKYATKEEGF